MMTSLFWDGGTGRRRRFGDFSLSGRCALARADMERSRRSVVSGPLAVLAAVVLQRAVSGRGGDVATGARGRILRRSTGEPRWRGEGGGGRLGPPRPGNILPARSNLSRVGRSGSP